MPGCQLYQGVLGKALSHTRCVYIGSGARPAEAVHTCGPLLQLAGAKSTDTGVSTSATPTGVRTSSDGVYS